MRLSACMFPRFGMRVCAQCLSHAIVPSALVLLLLMLLLLFSVFLLLCMVYIVSWRGWLGVLVE